MHSYALTACCATTFAANKSVMNSNDAIDCLHQPTPKTRSLISINTYNNACVEM